MTDSDALMPSINSRLHGFTEPLILSTMVACLGSIQYGYHIAELNAPQQSLTCSSSRTNNSNYGDTYLGSHGYNQCINLTDEQFGAVTSIFSIGGLIGSLYAGKLGDKYGRKLVSIWTCLLSMIGSYILFSANDYFNLLLGRLLVGISCGTSVVITPLYINEISPVKLRGTLGSMNQLSINLGILLTQSIAIKFSNELQWRWILFAGILLAFINLLCWFKIYESPKWLLTKGNNQSLAEVAVYYLREGTYQDAKNELQKWLEEHREHNNAEGRESGVSEDEISFMKYLKDSKYKKSRMVIFTILVGQQFSGINSIIFYGVKIISGMLPKYAILINFMISILNVVVTFIASLIIDKFGRKPLLFTSSTLMSIASFFLTIAILNSKPVLLVMSVFFYIGSFAIGLGPIPFLIISELSPIEALAISQSFGTVCNWISTFIVGYTFPILHQILDGYVFLLFTFWTIFFAWYVKKYIPETKGKTTHSEVWRNY